MARPIQWKLKWQIKVYIRLKYLVGLIRKLSSCSFLGHKWGEETGTHWDDYIGCLRCGKPTYQVGQPFDGITDCVDDKCQHSDGITLHLTNRRYS